MLILFDQNVPRVIRRSLLGHVVQTSEQRGWKNLENGELLGAAERAGFEVFVTADQNLTYQQNLLRRRIALVVLGSGQWPIVRQYLTAITTAVNNCSEEQLQLYRYTHAAEALARCVQRP